MLYLAKHLLRCGFARFARATVHNGSMIRAAATSTDTPCISPNRLFCKEYLIEITSIYLKTCLALHLHGHAIYTFE